jgi:hypothetical protein
MLASFEPIVPAAAQVILHVRGCSVT